MFKDKLYWRYLAESADTELWTQRKLGIQRVTMQLYVDFQLWGCEGVGWGLDAPALGLFKSNCIICSSLVET